MYPYDRNVGRVFNSVFNTMIYIGLLTTTPRNKKRGKLVPPKIYFCRVSVLSVRISRELSKNT